MGSKGKHQHASGFGRRAWNKAGSVHLIERRDVFHASDLVKRRTPTADYSAFIESGLLAWLCPPVYVPEPRKPMLIRTGSVYQVVGCYPEVTGPAFASKKEAQMFADWATDQSEESQWDGDYWVETVPVMESI